MSVGVTRFPPRPDAVTVDPTAGLSFSGKRVLPAMLGGATPPNGLTVTRELALLIAPDAGLTRCGVALTASDPAFASEGLVTAVVLLAGGATVDDGDLGLPVRRITSAGEDLSVIDAGILEIGGEEAFSPLCGVAAPAFLELAVGALLVPVPPVMGRPVSARPDIKDVATFPVAGAGVSTFDEAVGVAALPPARATDEL